MPNLDVIYAAATALGQVIGRPVRLAELLATDEPMRINDKLTVEPAALLGEVVAIAGRGEEFFVLNSVSCRSAIGVLYPAAPPRRPQLPGHPGPQ